MYKINYTIRHNEKTHKLAGVLLDKSITFDNFKDAVKFMREFNKNKKPDIDFVGKPIMEVV